MRFKSLIVQKSTTLNNVLTTISQSIYGFANLDHKIQFTDFGMTNTKPLIYLTCALFPVAFIVHLLISFGFRPKNILKNEMKFNNRTFSESFCEQSKYCTSNLN